jgi:hypothetical protein
MNSEADTNIQHIVHIKDYNKKQKVSFCRVCSWKACCSFSDNEKTQVSNKDFLDLSESWVAKGTSSLPSKEGRCCTPHPSHPSHLHRQMAHIRLWKGMAGRNDHHMRGKRELAKVLTNCW